MRNTNKLQVKSCSRLTLQIDGANWSAAKEMAAQHPSNYSLRSAKLAAQLHIAASQLLRAKYLPFLACAEANRCGCHFKRLSQQRAKNAARRCWLFTVAAVVVAVAGIGVAARPKDIVDMCGAWWPLVQRLRRS